MLKQITLRSWPRAILHLDADAFFASVEQALHPELKGKPVITGAERGIVAAASYEAKACGVQRGVSLTEAAHLCPQLIMLPSDYESYSLFSQRMFAILRRFTPEVEEASIDEAFADLTGLRRLHAGDGYQGIAKQIQETVMTELDIGVSVGLSLSKGLAKLCSKFRKPRGFTAVPGHTIHLLLERTPLEKVWGFGPNTVALLRKLGCKTALDFVQRPQYFAEEHLGKIGVAIWSELRGECVHPVSTAPKTSYRIISKTKTFAPASNQASYVYAQALRNLESAGIKARRYALAPHTVVLFLKTHDFRIRSLEAHLSRASNSPVDLAPILRTLFDQLWNGDTTYRATGVILGQLQPAAPNQLDLFEDPLRVVKTTQIAQTIDAINARFGKHTLFLSDGVHLGATARAQNFHGRRGPPSLRQTVPLPGESTRRHLGIPMLQFPAAK